MRAHFIIERLKSGSVRLMLVLALVVGLCQLTLWLRAGPFGAVEALPSTFATAVSLSSSPELGSNALTLTWNVFSGAERRTLVANTTGLEAATELSVIKLAWQRTLNSLWVIGLALLVILGLGIPLGILRGRSRRNPLAWLLALPFAVGVCLPVFWMAATAAWWMLEYHSLPLPGGDTGGFDVVVRGSSAWMVERWPGFLVVALTALAGTGWLVRSVSGGIQHAAMADHLWVGRMRGMRESQLFHRHTLRNSLRPILLSLADLLPFVFGAAILAEGVLGYEGIGGMIYHAGTQRDLAVLLAGCVLLTVVVLAARVIGEISLGLIDPAVRGEVEKR